MSGSEARLVAMIPEDLRDQLVAKAKSMGVSTTGLVVHVLYAFFGVEYTPAKRGGLGRVPITVTLPADTTDMLKKVAARDGTSVSEALRRLIQAPPSAEQAVSKSKPSAPAKIVKKAIAKKAA